MSGDLVMAIDAGTGSGRAIIYDLTGTVVGAAQEEWTHPIAQAAPGGFDFSTGINGILIDRVIRQAIQNAGVRTERIAAVATTSMREGIVLYDENDAVLWACPNVDSRARIEAEKLVESGLADDIFHIAGDWVSITAPARLHWLKNNQPDVIARVRRMGMISDWLATRLTGAYFTEPSAGSSSALFDLGKRNWSAELVEAVGLDPSILPQVVESGTQIGTVQPNAAARSGLAPGTPVVAGGADTQLALLGLGRRKGDATLVGGSFWQMTFLTDTPVIDPAFGPRTLCHARPGEWMVEGIGFLSGFTLRWVRDAYLSPILQHAGVSVNEFDLIETLASKSPAGAVIATTACPMQSDNWRQPPLSFLGFELNQPGLAVGQLARGVMESGAFLAHQHLDRLEALSGVHHDVLQFTGGSSLGTLWPQIVADVIGRDIDIPAVTETTALGCAMLAATGACLFPTLDDAVQSMASPISRRVSPDPAMHDAYREIENRWSKITGTTTDLAAKGLLEPIWRPAGARP
ncbi:MAG: FGGY family carbohydrate kinase [Roseinatronobacter sp.]